MYIVAVGWIYVVLMMSIAESTPVAGVMTFLLYGVFPVAIILYLMNTPKRRQKREAAKNLQGQTTGAEPATDIALPHSETLTETKSTAIDPDQ